MSIRFHLSRTFDAPREHLTAAVVCIALVAMFVGASPAFAGQASSGELFFYPCKNCHTTSSANGKLPNDFKQHRVTLEGHDELGTGSAACLACHDDAAGDPGKLKVANGLIDIREGSAKVCFRCHADKYRLWEVKAHGRGDKDCTDAGCHDPHTPGWFFADGVRPFVGNGFQVKGVSERQPFSALAAPPHPPAVHTPGWLAIVASLGLVAAGGQIVGLVRGPRSKRGTQDD